MSMTLPLSLGSMRRGSIRRLALPAVVGLAAAGVIGAGLSPATFEATAVVGLDSGNDALRTALDLATSHSVVRRAASTLVGTDEDAAQLAANAKVFPTEAGTAVAITEIGADASRAARAATAVAQALVAEHETVSAAWRLTRDAHAQARLTALQAAAAQAHERLQALGGPDAASGRGGVAEQVAKAEAHVETIRAILASGSPPLSDKDVPPTVQVLQANYLDLIRRLAVARATLGDRHVTIIALQEGVRQASEVLTAEWKRLLRQAQGDLEATRHHQATLGKAGAKAGAIAAIEAARRATEQADAVVHEAEEDARQAPSNTGYHLISPASPPLHATGWSMLARLLLSVSAGIAGFGLALAGASILALIRRPRRTGAKATSAFFTEPAPFPSDMFDDSSLLDAFAEIRLTLPDASTSFASDEEAATASMGLLPSRSRSDDQELRDAFGTLVADVAQRESAEGSVPTIMVAANDLRGDTRRVALALAASAAENGLRALLFEGPRQQPDLAAAAELDGEPLLLNLFGTLRVALPAEAIKGLCLVPSINNGEAIAAALARTGQATLVSELTSSFDLLIIDGGQAIDSADAGLTADVFLRVEDEDSWSDAEHFLDTFKATPDAVLGIVIGGTFVPAETPRIARRPSLPIQSLGVPRPVGSRGTRIVSPRSGAYAGASRSIARRAIGIR